MALVALYLPVTGRSILCSKKLHSKLKLFLRSSRRVRKISASGPKRTSLQSAGRNSLTILSAGTIKRPSFLKPSAICILPWAISARLPKNSRWASPTRVTMPVLGLASSDRRWISPKWSCPISKTSFSMSSGM